MKIAPFFTVLALSLLFARKENKSQEIFKTEFQSIIDSNNVKGSILIYDLKKDLFYSNNFDWAKIGRLPASTYKIPHSIIALETNVVENDSTLFKWNGEKRAYKIWEQDLILRDAFQYSCVPCYQEIANKIGEKRMNGYLNKLQFGDMDVNSVNLDLFWLEGESNITQFQQIDFLKRFINSELQISKRTEQILKRIAIIEENDEYEFYGKTGLSIRNGNNNGWFVGYLKSEEDTYIFATNIEPIENTDNASFLKARKNITLEALEYIR
ncbi:class D beta-lactamase [Zunongwangia endophytica]|uniref:beta-lactamase n=1 Tax=Zunongwangia endophytica TaxID=1808945 RepID=A0ABV8HGH5_9FLAO|nr:class D beta-lactamase [Zunongwangia endophytica]MDN3596901.1 class D beta-lactamase [Zunongwangia endophytica]